MIRRSIVSIVSVCAALAVGIALGGGPLSHADDAKSTVSPTPSTAADTTLAKQAAFGQTWATQLSHALYGGKLAGRRIAIVTLPGASAPTVQQLRDGIAVAQGTVSTTVALTPALLDPDRKVAVDTLTAQFAHQSHGIIGARLAPYTRAGEMIGAVVDPAAGPQGSSVATTARETLVAAKLAQLSAPQGAASVVLVVVGDQTDAEIATELMWGLSAKVPGMVIAGDSASATGTGALAGLRRTKWSDKVMTVDGIDTAYGRVAAVAGLVAQLRSRGGSYGASGIDGLVPLG